jgi:hypothetical protein
MKKDDYLLGGHHRWVHFWCGLVFGAGLGAWIGWGLFNTAWDVAAIAAATGLVFGLCCGRWGDSAWQWFLERLWWIN